MKIHRPLVVYVLGALEKTFLENRHADKVLEVLFKTEKRLGARDRKFIAEEFYECVRWWRRYYFMATGDSVNWRPDSPELVYNIWLARTFQKYQALPDWWDQDPDFFRTSDEFLDGLEDRVRKNILLLKDQSAAIVQSWPDELFNEGERQLSDRWPAMVHSLNVQAPVDLRVDTLKISDVDFQHEMESLGFLLEKVKKQEHCFSLKERKNVFISEPYRKGLFEVQDRASQRVAPFMKLEPGMRVADGCAGAGGKTLHIANIMQNKGRVVALDIHVHKLEELKKRASRHGISIIETRAIENSKTIKRLEESFDRVLLDVPCTGLGVLRRNPDTKWKLQLNDFAEIQNLQSDILQRYSKMLKADGKLIYSTCSLLPSENEQQIEKFIQTNPNWQVEEMRRIDPDQGLGDGFFMARLSRTL